MKEDRFGNLLSHFIDEKTEAHGSYTGRARTGTQIFGLPVQCSSFHSRTENVLKCETLRNMKLGRNEIEIALVSNRFKVCMKYPSA